MAIYEDQIVENIFVSVKNNEKKPIMKVPEQGFIEGIDRIKPSLLNPEGARAFFWKALVTNENCSEFKDKLEDLCKEI